MDKDKAAWFIQGKSCPNCKQSGGVALTGQVVYGAPLRYEFDCAFCEHQGLVGYKSIQEPEVVFLEKRKPKP